MKVKTASTDYLSTSATRKLVLDFVGHTSIFDRCCTYQPFGLTMMHLYRASFSGYIPLFAVDGTTRQDKGMLDAETHTLHKEG